MVSKGSCCSQQLNRCPAPARAAALMESQSTVFWALPHMICHGWEPINFFSEADSPLTGSVRRSFFSSDWPQFCCFVTIVQLQCYRATLRSAFNHSLPLKGYHFMMVSRSAHALRTHAGGRRARALSHNTSVRNTPEIVRLSDRLT